jgi:hypothetical protein
MLMHFDFDITYLGDIFSQPDATSGLKGDNQEKEKPISI